MTYFEVIKEIEVVVLLKNYHGGMVENAFTH